MQDHTALFGIDAFYCYECNHFWVDGGESFSATTIPNVYVYVHGTKTIDYLNDRYVKMDSSLTEHPN